MQRVKVRDLRRGHETEHYRVLSAERADDGGVDLRVAYHDGGEGLHHWDHPDIEIEVRDEGQSANL